jgi:hypothetical protein
MDEQSDSNQVIIGGTGGAGAPKPPLTKKDKTKRAAIVLLVCILLTVLGATISVISLVLLVAMPVGFIALVYMAIINYDLLIKAETQEDDQWREAREAAKAAAEKQAQEPPEHVIFKSDQ